MNDKKRKCWLFYLITDDDYGIDKYDIYAYTDKKEYAESFIKTRNMDNFLLKERKLDRKDFNKLHKKYTSRYLVVITGKTRGRNSFKIKDFEIVLTEKEKALCDGASNTFLYYNIYKYTWISNEVFKKKYRNALDILLYGPINKTLCSYENDIDDIMKRIHIDYFRVIMMTYKKLFLKDGG